MSESRKTSANNGKQSTLFGFFPKSQVPKASPAAPRPATTPATPSTTDNGASSSAGSSSGVKPSIKTAPAKKAVASTPASEAIDLSSDGPEEFAAAPARTGASTSTSKAATDVCRSLAQLKSKVATASSPLPSNGNAKLSSAMPTPPLTSDGDDIRGNTSTSAAGTSASEMDMDDDDDGNIVRRKSNTKKGKKRVVQSDDDSGNSSAGPSKRPKTTTKASNKKGKEASPFMLSSGEDEEDFDDAGMDWDEAGALAEEAGPSSKKAKAISNPTVSSSQDKGKSSKLNAGIADLFSFKTDADIAKQERKVDYAQAGETFSFLHEDNIRDGKKHRPAHPDYDPRTLHIPPAAKSKFTPFEKQFWDIKENHMDTVLFFQKGKFFELYETDADIGHQLFDLKMTGRVKMRMVGVPEGSIDYWIAKFLGQGYKVGRVDQAETALGADLRRQDAAGKGPKSTTTAEKAKIVNRELKTVLTTGTIVDGHLLTEDLSNHCIAVKEYIEEAGADPRFGIVIADCSTAEFTLSAFQDDTCRTKLETTIRQHRPRELICEIGNLSVPTLRLLRACVGSNCTWNNLQAGKEFRTAKHAIERIQELFAEEQADVPDTITQFYEDAQAMSAMGGMLWYLEQLKLDSDLIAVKNFNIFDPIRDGQSLVLDGQTLAHIEVLQNSLGTDEGTLFKLMCRCSTPFGKRLFKIWVCQPLRAAKAINERLDAVEDLISGTAFVKTFERHAKKYPDLERLLSRIHARSCRVKDFLGVLEAFENYHNFIEDLKNASSDFRSHGIGQLLRSAPDLTPLTEAVRSMFHVAENELKPESGVDDDYDALDRAVMATEKKLDTELEKCKATLSDRTLTFKDIGTKDIYQITVPAKKKVPREWTKISSTKDVIRYYTPETIKLIDELKEYRERRDQASQTFQFKVYKAFGNDYHTWLEAVKVIAEIDCLVSLANVSTALGEPAVRPEIVEASHAFVDFEDLRHPCVLRTDSDFIPNDVKLGGSEKRMVLLTGPNMAGKSTLLRMSCIGVIMAQIGCYVPARSARVSPCDRIVSRMGASDNMLAGQSTFRVEMEDCKKILVESTPKTLVILDELGRGTSTFDGLSIAYSVLHQLAGHIGCIGYFATHFTSLTGDFDSHPQVMNKHMKTFVDEDTREVTFLYRLTDGCSPKSYGPHVASLAGVPRSIVERAITISKTFENRTLAREASKRKDQAISLGLQADTAYLMKLAAQAAVPADPQVLHSLETILKKLNMQDAGQSENMQTE